MNARAMSLRVFCAAVVVLGLSAAPALAAPVLDVQLTPAPGPSIPLTHSDERLAYEMTVKDTANPSPVVGTELSCVGASGGVPSPAITYEWLRNGTPIPGANAATYVIAPADEGESLQCRVTATNDADGAGTAFAPITSVDISLPPIEVEPASDPGPTGTSRPNMNGPAAAAPKGTATTTAGSNVLTEVITAKGSGDLSSGSNVITNVTTTTGVFIANSSPTQTIRGAGIPAGTEITAVDPFAQTLTLSKAATAAGTGVSLAAGSLPFQGAQHVFGVGIPAGTTITSSTGETLTLDKAATASGTGVVITGSSEEICEVPIGWSGTGLTWSFQWLRNGQPIPGAANATYVVQKSDTEPPSDLQCEAIAEDAGGNKAFAISSTEPTRPIPPAPYVAPGAGNLSIAFNSKTEGKVTAEAQLPPKTQVLWVAAQASPTGANWSCVKQPPIKPSKVICSREDSLAPGASYPPIEIFAQVFHDAADTLVTKASVSGGGALDVASTEDTVSGILPAVPFGFAAFETSVLDEDEDEVTQAGGHPFIAAAHLQFTEHVRPIKVGAVGFRAANGWAREIRTDVPPGFVGDLEALEDKCPSSEDVVAIPTTCPASSVVGGITIKSAAGEFENQPIYALEPERGTPAQLAFGVGGLAPGFAYTLTPELRPEDNYAITLVTAPIQKAPELFEVDATLCDRGGKIAPNPGKFAGETEFKGCRRATDPGATERPILSLPTRCGDPASSTTEIFADTWDEPGKYVSAKYTLPTPTGCEELDFEPELKARPTTTAADSPSGLEVDLEIPQSEDPEGTATAQLRKTVLTLPEGMTVNPSAANGLDACSPAQIGLGNNNPVSCPNASKVGTALATTPILAHSLPGTLYIATPHQNPFGSLLALYLVIEDPETGIVVKLPGKVEANPDTGRLTTTFDDNPQAPISDVRVDVRSGASAPLRTPAVCGKYTTTSELTPWSAPDSGPPAKPKDNWTIRQGAGGSGCSSSEAALPNSPSFEAGTTSAIAATFSPFVVKLSRQDGSQQFSAVNVSPPPGLLAKLAGTTQCPDSALAVAKTKTGKEEQASPSCPSASQIGSISAAAGAGPAPYNAPGKAYLAGPYKGAPLSFAFIAPAVAGPFDLGTVVVRAPAYVDPTTAQVTVKADPLPRILQGIPLDVRSVSVFIDRPQFTLNPTSCDPTAVTGQLTSTLGQVAALSSRFQVAECSRLAFKPKLKLQLHGGTRRGDYQGVSATLTAKPGEANIASASVTFPHSAFLAQEHIRTVCTRVQFAADQCPKGSIYGKATAITPLLDQPLTGPVYLRSSDNTLPDLVVALKGPDSLPVEIELAGRNDSKNGGIRNTFAVAPDAPLTKFTLRLQGGKKGLIVNSRNLCNGTQRAEVKLRGQNGKSREFKPVVGNGCGEKRKKHR